MLASPLALICDGTNISDILEIQNVSGGTTPDTGFPPLTFFFARCDVPVN